jgi:hypothetical protein
VLALFVIAISSMALANRTPPNFTFLPWTGATLTYWLLGLALFGLSTLLLAMGGKMRALFFLWSLAVFGLLFKGLFVSFYAFSGPVSFQVGLRLTVGSLLATLGSFPWSRESARVRRPQLY